MDEGPNNPLDLLIMSCEQQCEMKLKLVSLSEDLKVQMISEDGMTTVIYDVSTNEL
eukprot:Pgem_evm1s2340